jgi:glycosyltransferase involved in cell wall biosynthesis
MRQRMTTVFINGKFAAQRVTGVQRAAGCIVEAFDRLLPTVSGLDEVRWVLLCPPGASLPALRRIEVLEIGHRAAGLHFWEQVQLPFAARGQLLINLAGPAPLLKRHQICMLHDAAVFDFPGVHTRLFRAWYRFVFRRLARSASVLLTPSAFSKSRLREHLGLPSGRVAVTSGGGEHMRAVSADNAVLQRLGLQPGSYFVAVGSSNPIKNFMSLLNAFAALPSRCDAQLVIVGGANSEVFAAEGAPANVAGLVRAGPVSDAELKALYQSALALVFPSIYEGFGLPPLEAMACDCPVAASNAAAIPEVCGDAVLYFDPSKPHAIAEAMMRLFDEPALRQQLREHGARRAQALNWDGAALVLLENVRPAMASLLTDA